MSTNIESNDHANMKYQKHYFLPKFKKKKNETILHHFMTKPAGQCTQGNLIENTLILMKKLICVPKTKTLIFQFLCLKD